MEKSPQFSEELQWCGRNFGAEVLQTGQDTFSLMYSKQMYRFYPHSHLELGDASDCQDDEQIDSKILP